jgi:hypothetical protein
MNFSIDLVRLSNPGDFNRLEKCLLNRELATEHPTRMLILSEPGESKDHSSSDSATLNCKLAFPAQEQPASEGGLYTNCRPGFLSPAFTITSIDIVGAPTFSFRERATSNQQITDRGAGLSPNCQLSTVHCFSPLTPTIPALTQNRAVGGYVIGMVTYLKYVGAPTFCSE